MTATKVNVRDYLRSQGFTVGERGRFSAEMIEVAKAAGLLDENGKTPKAAKPAVAEGGDASPKAPRPGNRPKSVRVVVPQTAVRTTANKNHVAVAGNIRLVYDQCFAPGCMQHATFCKCASGPVPPKGFTALDARASLV